MTHLLLGEENRGRWKGIVIAGRGTEKNMAVRVLGVARATEFCASNSARAQSSGASGSVIQGIRYAVQNAT